MIDDLRRLLASGPSYVVLYLIFMLPTYILPYFGSNSLAANAILAAADSAAGGGHGANILLFIHLICLAVLGLLAWLRGAEVGKTWIVTFPVIAAVFDIVPGLSLIPLVPTVMHLGAIITGVSAAPESKA